MNCFGSNLKDITRAKTCNELHFLALGKRFDALPPHLQPRIRMQIEQLFYDVEMSQYQLASNPNAQIPQYQLVSNPNTQISHYQVTPNDQY